MGTELAKANDAALLEQVIIKGDLRALSESDRVQYYARVCDSIGFNALTRPFEYIVLNGKMTLYATRSATDQLRKLYGVSISKLERESIAGVYTVTAYAQDKNGRCDSSLGAVTIEGLRGDALANAMMKAETKSKRRVTLSLCGLGMLDETEVETIPDAKVVQTVVSCPSDPDAHEPPAEDPVINVDPIDATEAFMAKLGETFAECGFTLAQAEEATKQVFKKKKVTSCAELSESDRKAFIKSIRDGVFDPMKRLARSQKQEAASA